MTPIAAMRLRNNGIHVPWANVIALFGYESFVPLVEESQYGHAFTTTGVGAETGIVKYGVGSGAYATPGNFAFLSINNNARFNFGSGDFCFETWLHPTDAPATEAFLVSHYNASYGGGSGGLIVQLLADMTVRVGRSNDAFVLTSTASLSLDDWTHLSVQRDAGLWSIFFGGVPAGTVTDSRSLSATGPMEIGGWDLPVRSERAFNGFMDETRICDVAPYPVGGFQPPAGPFDRG